MLLILMIVNNKPYRLAIFSALCAGLFAVSCTKTERANPPDDFTRALDGASHSRAETAPPILARVETPATARAETQSQHAPQNVAAALPAPSPIALTGQQPYFPVRRCINVANALEAPNEGEWGYTIRREDLSAIRKAGFDTIRLPVRWDTHMQMRAPYTVDPAFITRVNQVVGQAQSLGLGVIIDVHHYEDLIERPSQERARFIALWDQIARNFANAPDTVYFEILNEPTNKISMRQVNQLYRDVIPVIRASNPSRVLIMGGNNWNSVETMDLVDWPQDRNIVATFHDYGPHEFTHQGTPWTDNQWPMGRAWGGRADRAEKQDTYDIAARFQARHNRKIFVGEFGVYDKVPQSERNEWMRARRKMMEAAGYSWCAWDLDGTFTHYDTKRREWLPGALNALMGD